MSKPSQAAAGASLRSAGRPKASDVEARIQDLIDVAAQLFLSNGYTRTSLESIARAARVAVRTIYVKFGGKAGLLNAVLMSRRDQFFRMRDMDKDTRPFREVVDDFAHQFFDLLAKEQLIAMQRVVIAEAPGNPELAEIFYGAGPRLTREMLERYFARPDVRAQLREDLPFAQLPTILTSTIAGDSVQRFVFPHKQPPRDEAHRLLDGRLALFYRAVLR
ncbi:TetR/AcrR family transcriptional regulator [Massilia sp. Dwa41.01b]|uniref:TetR/AcrR family transcriptional regulator n=1 Tax=unclassified Massilia TaxID=2609279 RepID=UPI001602EB0C|nr:MULTISPECIES: TetR/AcrR family transcriptional regulator [unclassified Massilia]QNA90188.1 TetR/AcrR family transcriptional regulator [Massilia sp. Dwa41.01b]QNB01079.1 TetR/AcrR family transcriptional regulator [Massilia sp. Se16.2.3]